MLKNYALMLCCVFVLCACGGNARKAKLPDASEGYSINCNGTDADWADCYNQASSICDGKYAIINTNTSAVGETPMRNIIVKCNK